MLNRHLKSYRKFYGTHGQAMVETAIAMPFLLLILLGVVYFGQYFYTLSVISFAAQQGALQAASTPDLLNPDVRDLLRGFSPSGEATNTGALVYSILSSASLLSSGKSGNLPEGSRVLILPYDDAGASALPAGAVALQITYPFQLFGAGSPFNGPVLGFSSLNIVQQAAAFPQIYQEAP